MKELLKTLLCDAIKNLQAKGEFANDIVFSVQIERAREKQHGDFASNIAMILAKAVDQKPRDLAALIVANLPSSPLVKEVSIAGPGFINFFLSNNAFLSAIPEILNTKDRYGFHENPSKLPIHLEFVSSNPTGPLHVGHGRGAAYGATLADLLATAGYAVHREYYVNDGGRQMDILAVSVWLRYLELLGAEFVFPSNGYKGDYVKDIATELKMKQGTRLQRDIKEVFHDVPEDAIAGGTGDKEAHIDGLIVRAKLLLGDENYRKVFDLVLNATLTDIKEDLAAFGVHYQEWFSERSLMESGAVTEAIEALKVAGHVYERDGALWFHSIPFGDDKDRVLVRDNGQTTYFASDVAYLLNKSKRGFEKLIYVVGADHHGYLPRLKAAATALGIDQTKVLALVVQFATLYRGAERVQMSTRSGSFVTLRELREEVGKDAARFFYVSRKIEQHMDFDLELAKSQSADNPMYYIQYAHARICSVFRQLAEKNEHWDQAEGLTALNHLNQPHEKTLLVDLSRYHEVIETAVTGYDPHLLTTFLRELAHDFHTYYNAHQFLVPEAKLRNARLCLIAAISQIIVNGLKILGVSAPEAM